jgi:hypothetical protein
LKFKEVRTNKLMTGQNLDLQTAIACKSATLTADFSDGFWCDAAAGEVVQQKTLSLVG